jgi:hypothetical protein
MWNSRKVEQALFQWPKWRQSIVAQWVNVEVEIENLTSGQLKVKSRRELQKLGFPASSWLALYWICCIASDCNLDRHASFHSIVIPTWLPQPFSPSLQAHMEPGRRIYPPYIFREGDEELQFRRFGMFGSIQLREDAKRGFAILLPSHHELYQVLNRLKGSPKMSGKPGRHSWYSDHLAVKCAVWKDRYGMTYDEIGCKIESELPDKLTEEGKQTGVAIYLVDRGRKLIASLGNQGGISHNQPV